MNETDDRQWLTVLSEETFEGVNMTESTARHYEDLARDVAAGTFDAREVVEALEAAAFNTRQGMASHKERMSKRASEERKANPEQDILALVPKLSFAARARVIAAAQR